MGTKKGKDKPEMTEEQTKELLLAANELRTGEKLSPALIAIIAISVFGIVVYVYTGIAEFGIRSLPSYFPLLMYVLMYISVIQYVINYFYKGEDASIDGMLMRYCALTAASVIISGEGIDQGVLVIDVLILLLVPFVRENLMQPKKGLIIAIIIAVLSICAAAINVAGNAAALESLTGAAWVAVFFNAINPTVQWLLFLALYIIRLRKAKVLVGQVMAQRAQDAQQDLQA